MSLMAAGRLRIEPLITRHALEEIAQGFEELDRCREGLFKAVVVP